MENLERCFFCCKNISQEKQNKFKDPFDSFNYEDATVKNINRKRSLKYVLQIFNYLKVPKSVLEEDSSEVTSSITTCLDCTKISTNLSKLCAQLEKVNLKISHYFNLLADQILEIPSENDDDDQVLLTDFQKLVHEKCLFKVHQDNFEPQNDLETSPNSPIQNLSEDTSNQSIILDEPPDEIKIEIKVEDEESTSEIELEVAQMKINYNLNLLTDQTLQREDVQLDHQQTNMSPFQEIFYNKCLSKLAKTDSDPVLQLTECSILPDNNATEVCTEEHDNFEAQVTKLEEKDNQDEQYIEMDAQDDPDYQYDALDEQDNTLDDDQEYDPFSIQMNKLNKTTFPCSLCPLIFNNSKNQQSHIETVHVKQKTSAGHLIKACEYCGAMISSRNLSQYKKRMHGMGQLRNYEKCACGIFIRDSNLKSHKLICRKINQKQPVECDICGNMISYTNIKAHKKKVHGIMSENGLANEMVIKEDPLQ